jgi:glycosyltransferase involved in cell wall biosynthesis
MDRLATRLPTVAVGCSSATSQRAQQALLPHRPTFVVNPGVDAAGLRAQAATEPRAQLRARLGIPPERAVIAVAARLQPDKGQDRLLEAVALLRRDGVDAHCLVVGGDAHGLSPEYAAGLPRLAARLGLGDRVTFAGQVAEVAPYLAAADVVVNAAEGEAFGIAILEAMAVGCPIVAVAAAGPAEILEPGVTGVLAADGQPATLAADLATLLADESRRARLGAAARVAVERRFTSTRAAQRLAAELGALALG